MFENGINAVPFSHPDLNKWRNNFVGVQTHHKDSNFLFFGAIDDVWETLEGELLLVDYKATSKNGEVNLDSNWQISYKRQIEIYQWLLRQNGFKVSSTGWFVYANGRTDLPAFNGKLEFKINLIPYEGDDSWVETA